MDLHVYRNSEDRWHDLRQDAVERGAILGLHAITIDELVRRLTPEVRMAETAQRLVLVQGALETAPSRSVSGVLRYALEAIADLKAAGAPLNSLDILPAYNAALERAGLIDFQDRCWLAAARAKDRGSWLARFDRVILHAIYDLTEAEFALIRNVIEVLPDGGTVILFNTTANVKPTQFAEWTWQRFVYSESLAERTFPEFCRPSSPNRSVLERLFIFDPPGDGQPQPFLDPLSSLEVLEVPGRFREIEIIGGRIADLLAHGENASQIAVVVHHIDTYGEMIQDVFSRYEIPHHFATGIPLLRVPFIKYWFALLDLAAGERSRNTLSRVLSSSYFQPRIGTAFDVQRELAAIGYIDRSYLSASDLARRKNSALTAELERLETWLNRLESMSETLSGFLREFTAPSNLTARDAQAWQILADELNSASSADRTYGFEDFRHFAIEVASLCTTSRAVPAEGGAGFPQVRVIRPWELGYRSFRWIFSPGHVDGEIPSYTPANPLLPDNLVEEINGKMRPRRLLSSRDRHRREPLYLFSLLDSATMRVTLTYPGKTLEGQPIFPSSYLLELGRHFSEPIVQRIHEAPAVRESGEVRRRVAAEWRDGSIDDRGAGELLGQDILRRARREALGAGRARVAPAAIAVDGVWHPSELNALADCPFVFLARNRMRIRIEELPDFEVPAMEVGRLAHEILRAFYTTPLPPSFAEACARMEDLIQRYLAPMDVNGQGSTFVFDPALWAIRRRQLVAALREYVTFAVKDAFDGFETLPQYLDAPLPPARLGSIQLGGKPDHVAVRGDNGRADGIRIDDFKYSAASSATNKLLNDSFQIPVYAYLAAQMLHAGPETQIEGRYLLLRSPSTPVVAHAIDAVVFEDVQSRIEKLVDKVRGGRLEPDPADRQACTSCDYRRLCRLYGG